MKCVLDVSRPEPVWSVPSWLSFSAPQPWRWFRAGGPTPKCWTPTVTSTGAGTLTLSAPSVPAGEIEWCDPVAVRGCTPAAGGLVSPAAPSVATVAYTGTASRILTEPALLLMATGLLILAIARRRAAAPMDGTTEG